MDVDFTLTVDDVKACQRHFSQVLMSPARYLALCIAVAALVAGMLAYAAQTGRGVAFVLGLVAGLALGVLPRLWANRQTSSAVDHFARDAANRWVFAPRRLNISQEGVTIVGAGHRSVQTWEIIAKVEETNDYCFLVTSTTTAHIVPRRAFADERTFHQFIMAAHQFKQGRRTADITTEPLRKLPQRTADLFDPNSSY